jgi:hypothetical protein
MGLFLLGLAVGAVEGPVACLVTLEIGCRRRFVWVPTFTAATAACPLSPPALLEPLLAGAGAAASSLLRLVLFHPLLVGEE